MKTLILVLVSLLVTEVALGAVSLPLGEMLSVAVLVAIWIGLLPLLYRISHRMAPAA